MKFTGAFARDPIPHRSSPRPNRRAANHLPGIARKRIHASFTFSLAMARALSIIRITASCWHKAFAGRRNADGLLNDTLCFRIERTDKLPDEASMSRRGPGQSATSASNSLGAAFSRVHEPLEQFGILFEELREVCQHIHGCRAEMVLDSFDVLLLRFRAKPEQRKEP